MIDDTEVDQSALTKNARQVPSMAMRNLFASIRNCTRILDTGNEKTHVRRIVAQFLDSLCRGANP